MPKLNDNFEFVLRMTVHGTVTKEMMHSIMTNSGLGLLKENGIKLYKDADEMQTCLVFFKGLRTSCSPENLIRNRDILRHLSEKAEHYADIPYFYSGKKFLYRARIDRRLSGLDPFPTIGLGAD